MAQTSFRSQMVEAFRVRVFFYIGIVLFVFIVVIFQLINLQFVHGAEYVERARSNMEDFVPIVASRGEVFDRNFSTASGNNKVIVSNRASFNISTVPAKFNSKKGMQAALVRLSEIVDLDVKSVMKEYNAVNPWQRIIIREDVSFEKIVKIASHKDIYVNIDWEVAPVRVYNYGSMFSHVVGYIGSISKKEFLELKDKGYRYYQKLGKSGIERQYDEELRGTDGSVKRIVDVRNRTEGEEIGFQPVSGNNVVLTLDLEVQKAAFEAFEGLVGSAIVIKAGTGEVISLVSKPGYNPNAIISKNNQAIIRKLYADTTRPFLNRVIQSKYPPASTFKLVTAISALEEEKWEAERIVNCPGYFVLKGMRDTIIYDYAVFGRINLIEAIGKSASVYFYTMGYKIGPTSIMNYANHFGLNERSGIDLPGEVAGFVPSQKWKRKKLGEGWYDGDTINLAIGQGFLAVTPISMANLVCGIVNNGIIYRPQVVKEIRSPDNSQVLKALEPEKIREIPLTPSTLNVIKTGMRLSVKNGTSRRLSYLPVDFAGKTGTAQTRSVRDSKYTQHGWFIGYGPYGAAPEDTYVIMVMVEYGIAGAATAVPIAEKVFAKMIEQGYFDVQK
ncbi:MAG: penicillin-binding protein 2 [Spirochaetes bacterium]|jgi:penicillin-binding protein 2|nr:penicillin-binding protein 2 [Spirochaetota bacterium]